MHFKIRAYLVAVVILLFAHISIAAQLSPGDGYVLGNADSFEWLFDAPPDNFQASYTIESTEKSFTSDSRTTAAGTLPGADALHLVFDSEPVTILIPKRMAYVVDEGDSVQMLIRVPAPDI